MTWDFGLILGCLLVLFYWYQTKNFNYWKDRKVPYIKPDWLFGNVKNPLLNKTTWKENSSKLYNAFKETGFGGIFVFRKPSLLICDSGLAEKVLVQDFDHFHDRVSQWSPSEVLTDSLYDASGGKWRAMRSKLVSIFSSAKLKGMFQQILNCSDHLANNIEGAPKSLELEPFLFEFVAEAIASCMFGIQLMTNPSERMQIRSAAEKLLKPTPLNMVRIIYSSMHPRITSALRINCVPKPIAKFFANITKSVINYREQSAVKRSDFLQLLLTLKEEEEAKNKNFTEKYDLEEDDDGEVLKGRSSPSISQHMFSEEKVFTENTISSQMFNFLVAGTNPTVTTVNFALFEIARNPQIKKKLQEEIDSVILKQNGWKFEGLKDMTYLDQVIQETLRVYSYNNVLMRSVTKPYVLPGTDVILEKGMLVYIMSGAILMDPQYYPAPEKFRPERFADNNFKPSPTFLAFGHGPRVCIAIKFVALVMKVCLARVLSRYEVSLSPKTLLPLRFCTNVYYPKNLGGLWFQFNKRNHGNI